MRFEQCQTQGASEFPSDSPPLKQSPSTQRALRLPHEQSRMFERSSGDFTQHNLAAPVNPSTEPVSFYAQTEKRQMPHHAAPNGFSHQSHHFYSASHKAFPPSFQHSGHFGASRLIPVQQFPMETHSHAVTPMMAYSIPGNGSEERFQPAQQSQPEYVYAPSTPSMHNEYQSSSRAHNRVGHRRGSQSQKVHGCVPDQQISEDHHSTGQDSHLNKSWRQNPEQHGVRQSSWCRNAGGLAEYCHCTCKTCSERNRSIWVRVSYDFFPLSIMDIQSLLKSGISSRFGRVDEVFPAASHKKDAFITRCDPMSMISLC